jgi:hypothetical protein
MISLLRALQKIAKRGDGLHLELLCLLEHPKADEGTADDRPNIDQLKQRRAQGRRFTPENRHSRDQSECPLSATSRHRAYDS